MKRLWAIFVLTPREQRLVIFVVLALVVGVSVKHHRDMKVSRPPQSSVEPSQTPLVSPTPNDR
jgi:hypothetical protein